MGQYAKICTIASISSIAEASPSEFLHSTNNKGALCMSMTSASGRYVNDVLEFLVVNLSYRAPATSLKLVSSITVLLSLVDPDAVKTMLNWV